MDVEFSDIAKKYNPIPLTPRWKNLGFVKQKNNRFEPVATMYTLDSSDILKSQIYNEKIYLTQCFDKSRNDVIVNYTVNDF